MSKNSGDFCLANKRCSVHSWTSTTGVRPAGMQVQAVNGRLTARAVLQGLRQAVGSDLGDCTIFLGRHSKTPNSSNNDKILLLELAVVSEASCVACGSLGKTTPIRLLRIVFE